MAIFDMNRRKKQTCHIKMKPRQDVKDSCTGRESSLKRMCHVKTQLKKRRVSENKVRTFQNLVGYMLMKPLPF